MNEFFTWNILGTYAGAVLATTLITQLLKSIPGIEKIPTRIFSYIVAALILLGAALYSGTMNWSNAGLAFINAAVVALASNGAFDAARCTGEYCKNQGAK